MCHFPCFYLLFQFKSIFMCCNLSFYRVQVVVTMKLFRKTIILTYTKQSKALFCINVLFLNFWIYFHKSLHRDHVNSLIDQFSEEHYQNHELSNSNLKMWRVSHLNSEHTQFYSRRLYFLQDFSQIIWSPKYKKSSAVDRQRSFLRNKYSPAILRRNINKRIKVAPAVFLPSI